MRLSTHAIIAIRTTAVVGAFVRLRDAVLDTDAVHRGTP
jgi:hypothetical protein